MNTDELILQLSADVPPVRRHALHLRVTAGMVVGGMLTAALVAALGFRSDLPSSLDGFSFWAKLTYTISIACISVAAAANFGRPTETSTRRTWLLAAPLLMMAGVAIGELSATPVEGWRDMWLGQTWSICPLLVLGLSVPIFLGLVWAFRRLAPTRLRLTGAVAGLTAGAWAATLYCLHCQETSALFVLTWYSLGILLAAGVGAALGPRLLRW